MSSNEYSCTRTFIIEASFGNPFVALEKAKAIAGVRGEVDAVFRNIGDGKLEVTLTADHNCNFMRILNAMSGATIVDTDKF